MGNRIIELQVPLNQSEEQWRERAQKKAGVKQGKITILKKSLDARKKSNLHWRYRISIDTAEIKNYDHTPREGSELQRNLQNLARSKALKKEKILVVGSGPAGIFSGLALAEAGLEVDIIEQGLSVEERKKAIEDFHSGGSFNIRGNYAFGEGGAGTFSDGKLTSRTKGISNEKEYIYHYYLKSGAPEEIQYLPHPHLGSDRLIGMTQELRREFMALGGTIRFEHSLDDIVITSGKVQSVVINGVEHNYDRIILALGHSNYESYRMLMKRGVKFRPKIFGLGFRAEHPQELINLAQWGKPRLTGVKAAEYRLSAGLQGNRRVYSFCMCPGGLVVPAAPSSDVNIVNGMSYYQRDLPRANAAVVCSFHPSEFLGDDPSALDCLAWLENLERHFKELGPGFSAPSCSIGNFLNRSSSIDLQESSYPLGLKECDLWNQIPEPISDALQEGLRVFSQKLNGYEKGQLLGLESKTSAPIQVLQSDAGHVDSIENLYLAGEGSGWAGGIISSAAHGLRIAQSILRK